MPTSSDEEIAERPDNRSRDKHRRKRERRRRRTWSSSDDESSSFEEHRRRRKKRRKKEKKAKKRRSGKKSSSRGSDETDSFAAKAPQDTAVSHNLTATHISSAFRCSDETVNPAMTQNMRQQEEDARLRRQKALAPMSREEFEKQQSTIREVYDEQSGRIRLMRGTGEIIERIVSATEHASINRQATKGDGISFARDIFRATRR